MNCDEATFGKNSMPTREENARRLQEEAEEKAEYKYGLSLPEGTQIEEIWEKKEIDFEVMSSGCGSGEYLFKSKYARDMALKLFNDNCISTFVLED